MVLTSPEVYRYSIYDTPSSPRRTSIIPPNDNSNNSNNNLNPASADDTETASFEAALSDVSEQNEDEDDEGAEADADDDDDSEAMSENSDQDEESPLQQSRCHSDLNRPIIRPRAEYRGAANVRTVKDGVCIYAYKARLF